MGSANSSAAATLFVDNSDIGKSASSHDQIVSSSCSISVKVFLFNAFLLKESSSWRVYRDISSWRYMICRDGVSKQSQNVSILNFSYFRQLFFGRFKEWGVMDVC